MKPAILLVAVFFLLSAHPASAQTTITVTTLDTEQNDDGDCSFREALWSAVVNQSSDACAAGTTTGVDTIAFAVSGTIDVDGLPSIDDDTVLDGPGAEQLTLRAVGQAGNDRRLLRVEAATATVRGLTLTDAVAESGSGAAILVFNGGALRLVDSVLRGNQAAFGGGAIYLEEAGESVIERCLFEDNDGGGRSGGAIWNNRTPLTIRQSAFVNNRATLGGGVATTNASTTLRVENSTFSGNAAADGGGGLYIGGGDGNELAHVTLTANATDGNGGGVLIGDNATVRFRNVLAAGNQDDAATGSVLPDVATFGTAVSEGHNLIGDGTGSSFTDGDHGDQVGTAAQPLDPRLNALSDDGDTQTHPLQPDSPALDAGTCDGLSGNSVSVDQRGVARPQGSACDIGAFEREATDTARSPASTPAAFRVSNVYPNPFHRTATVTLTLDQPQAVTVAVFDVLGRRVQVLHRGHLPAGPHTFSLDAAWPSGLYVVRVTGTHTSITRTALLAR
jgi:hypothetical protein